MNAHHLVLGKLKDVLSGRIIDDTHDERHRQKLARLLIHEKKYRRDEIESRFKLAVTAGERKARVNIDFVLSLARRTGMLIYYGPGSIVTRHQPAVAASRLIAPYQIPMVVVTNGNEAETIDGSTGRVLGRGLTTIPDRAGLSDVIARFRFSPITARQAELASRVLYAFEVDDRCPCDDSICKL